MGIPYSKQINAAFDQVTPLVSSGYELLETVKNIAIFITVIQIGIIAVLCLNLLALLGLVYSINPDLEDERKNLVTPAMKTIATWSTAIIERKWSICISMLGLAAAVMGAYSYYVYRKRHDVEQMAENAVRGDDDVADDTENVEQSDGTDDGAENANEGGESK